MCVSRSNNNIHWVTLTYTHCCSGFPFRAMSHSHRHPSASILEQHSPLERMYASASASIDAYSYCFYLLTQTVFSCERSRQEVKTNTTNSHSVQVKLDSFCEPYWCWEMLMRMLWRLLLSIFSSMENVHPCNALVGSFARKARPGGEGAGGRGGWERKVLRVLGAWNWTSK